uniref:Uncharacterized protein n=1 Tax=Mycena chlorophos TaxID=658473 RepID=A0ABQ0LAF8_MYCCL|nr:predicted protein [Mycena chlorophos]
MLSTLSRKKTSFSQHFLRIPGAIAGEVEQKGDCEDGACSIEYWEVDRNDATLKPRAVTTCFSPPSPSLSPSPSAGVWLAPRPGWLSAEGRYVPQNFANLKYNDGSRSGRHVPIVVAPAKRRTWKGCGHFYWPTRSRPRPSSRVWACRSVNPAPSLLSEPAPSSIRGLVRDMRGSQRLFERIEFGHTRCSLPCKILSRTFQAPQRSASRTRMNPRLLDSSGFSVPHPEFLYVGRDGKLHLVVGQHRNSLSGNTSGLNDHHLSKPSSSSLRIEAVVGEAARMAWKFASNFSRKWQKDRWPSELFSSSDSRIRKNAIENSIKLGPTRSTKQST